MLIEIKKNLLENKESIKNILEYYDFHHIDIKKNEIRFARSIEGSKNSIQIKLQNNDKLYVSDYPKSICRDFFTYIMNEKQVEFGDVLNTIKQELNITDYFNFNYKNKSIFGGFYSSIKKQSESQIKIYDNSILKKYQNNGCIRFLKDNISLLTQRHFNIMYDVESQGIVIPIYDVCGNIIGIKIRCNWEVTGGEKKYYYLIPCLISETLYGYYQNYKYLTDETIFIVESEKSVLQAHSYGLYNFIATGGSSLSSKQCKLIMELSPKKIIFLYDEGLDKQIIYRNINKMQVYTKMFDIEIGYWNHSNCIDVPKKCSPTDLSFEELKDILYNKIDFVERGFYEKSLECN